MLRLQKESFSFEHSRQGWKQETIADLRFPDIGISGGAVLPAVAAIHANVVWQIVVEPKIKAVDVHQGEVSARCRSALEELLNAGDAL